MSKRTLLLADDSVTIQKVVNLTFADEGIDVVTVGDGDSALQKISEVSPDVVLADVHMPGLNGYQICEIVRENPKTKDMPVVLLVGSFEPFDEDEAARVGANAFLTKPFQSIRQLVTQVSDLIEVSAGPVEPEPDVSFEDTDENLPITESMAEAADGGGHDAEQPRKAQDTTDIDHLYRQSFGGPTPQVSGAEQTNFVDAGMDDEMIETSHAGHVSAQDSQEFAEERTPEDFREADQSPVTSPLETASFEAPAAEEQTAEAQWDEVPVPSVAQFQAVSETEETTASYAVPEGEYATDPVITSPFDSLAMPETSENLSQEPSQPEAYFDQYSSTEQMNVVEQQVEEAASTFDLDEVNLLELPPLENGGSVELTSSEPAPAEPAKKQVMSLSPELMEMIVQKVVDKLSEKD